MDSELTMDLPREINDLSLSFSDGKLRSLSVFEKSTADNSISIVKSDSDNMVVEKVLLQIKEYFFSTTPFHFENLMPAGTVFQQSVWTELCNIPFGEIRTYGDVAKKLNSSARAVGNACRKNPIQIIIPCHRVVSAKGLGGYAGETDGKQLNIKRWLLNHEGIEL